MPSHLGELDSMENASTFLHVPRLEGERLSDANTRTAVLIIFHIWTHIARKTSRGSSIELDRAPLSARETEIQTERVLPKHQVYSCLRTTWDIAVVDSSSHQRAQRRRNCFESADLNLDNLLADVARSHAE